jgi:hypothetical protein
MNGIRRHRVVDGVTTHKQNAVPVAHVVALHADLGTSPHSSKEYRHMPMRSLSADSSRAGFCAPGLGFNLVYIQLADVNAAVTVEQRLSKTLYFVFALLEKAQAGADDFARGPVAPTGYLLVDEALEVVAETDTGGLAHFGLSDDLPFFGNYWYTAKCLRRVLASAPGRRELSTRHPMHRV